MLCLTQQPTWIEWLTQLLARLAVWYWTQELFHTHHTSIVRNDLSLIQQLTLTGFVTETIHTSFRTRRLTFIEFQESYHIPQLTLIACVTATTHTLCLTQRHTFTDSKVEETWIPTATLKGRCFRSGTPYKTLQLHKYDTFDGKSFKSDEVVSSVQADGP